MGACHAKAVTGQRGFSPQRCSVSSRRDSRGHRENRAVAASSAYAEESSSGLPKAIAIAAPVAPGARLRDVSTLVRWIAEGTPHAAE